MLAPTPAETLLALSRVFEEQGARWYVFGAQAVLAYGLPRLTTDLDVTVELSLDEASNLIDRLERAGFTARTDNVEALAQRSRVIPVVHDRTGMPVDIVIAGPGLESEFLDRACLLDLGGEWVPVMDPADLVATKILAGRPKDLADVEGILREQEDLNLERTREILSLLELALARSDLVAELDRTLDRRHRN